MKMQGPIRRNTVSPDGTPYSSVVFSGETVFLPRGPLFHQIGPRVSPVRTFSKTQRSYSNETPSVCAA